MPKQALAIAGGLALAVVVAYALHFRGDFVWDDKVYLLDNPRMAAGSSFVAAVKTPLAGQVFRPVSTATLWLQVQLHGFSMVGFRAAQLAIHLGCAAALFVWLRRRLASMVAALAGAAVFAAHPAATEAVMFANARHDVLGTLFALLAVLVVADGTSPRRGLFAGVLAMFAIGCKESFVILVPLLAVHVFASPIRESLAKRLAIATGPTLLAAGLVFALRRSLAISTASALSLGPLELARAFASLVVRHVSSFVTFTDGPTAERYVPPSTMSTVVVLVLATTVSLALAWRSRNGGEGARVAFIGCVTVLLGLLPSIAAVPATGQHGNRYGYFALAGFAALLASVVVPVTDWLRTRAVLLQRVSVGAAIVLFLLVALETAGRSADWHDGLTLFGADVARNPDDSRANYHFGVEVVAVRGCEEALPYFRRAAAAEPTWPRPFRNIAGCALRLGRPADALDAARVAVSLEPLEPAHHRNLAAALLGTGDVAAARVELDEAERLAPGAPQNEALRRAFPP